MDREKFIAKWFGNAESDVRKLQLLEFTEDLQKVVGDESVIPLQTKLLDGVDELLARRESKKQTLRELDNALLKAFAQMKCFPRRWYVRNPNGNVINYLNKKYDRGLSYNVVAQRVLAGIPLGYGESRGDVAVVPHDVDYSWEITQKEFDFIIKIMEEK